MPNQKRQRTSTVRMLAAIMFTDIVGYTALMSEDENSAYQLLKKNRRIQKSIIEKHHGKWLKEMGDGVLASFPTVSEAVHCAIEIQMICSQEADLKLRIGIHQGEVIVEDEDVFGDGVNIASRLEPLAPVGGIIVSESVYRNIQNKKGIETVFVGEESLKNVKNPVKIYQVMVSSVESFQSYPVNVEYQNTAEFTKSTHLRKRNAIITFFGVLIIFLLTYLIYSSKMERKTDTQILKAELNVQSIAVLPFIDLSPNRDKEYFTDGMVEEILNHLYKIGDLKVTSRTSTMRYKGETDKSVKEIATELGVANILEGSVRLDRNTVRITVQLIRATTDEHLWAEDYDRDFSDIFSIQSEVAQEVARSLKAEISPEAKRIIDMKPTDNAEAYDLYLKAEELNPYNVEERQRAMELYEKALELDPDFSLAYSSLGFLIGNSSTYLTTSESLSPVESWNMAKPYYERALILNPDNGIAHRLYAWSLLWYEWNFDAAGKEYKETQRIFPNYSWTDYHVALGQFEEAYEGAIKNIDFDSRNSLAWTGVITSAYFANHEPENEIRKALTTPIIKDNIWVRSEAARLYMYMEEYDEAIFIIEQLRKDFPEVKSPRLAAIEAISYLKMNQPDETKRIIEKLRQSSMETAAGSPSFYIAMIYAQLGENDKVFDWLHKAYEEHEVEMYWLKVEPPFEPIRSDPRYQEILTIMNFPV